MSIINQHAVYSIIITEKLEVVCYVIAVTICAQPSTADEVLAEMCSDFVQHPTLPFFSRIFMHALTQEPYILHHQAVKIMIHNFNTGISLCAHA